MVFDTGKQVRTLSLKFYVEQLMTAEQRSYFLNLTDGRTRVTKDAIEKGDKKFDLLYAKQIETKLVRDFFKKVEIVLGDWNLYTIYHNKDTKKDDSDPFQYSIKKGHFHLAVWRDNSKRFRIKQLLTMLGLSYTSADWDMWSKRGAEPIHDKATLLTYFLHMTPDAIQKGKSQYSIEEIHTNREKYELEKWLNAYNHRTERKTRLSQDDWDKLGEDAYALGKSLHDYDNWEKKVLHLNQRSGQNARILRKEYSQGLREGISNSKGFARLSILIWGDANQGKSYTAHATLQDMNLKICEAVAGTGKYDSLSSTDDALFFDDVSVSQARNVFDNRPALLHRRNSDDRVFLGRYAVATTNDDPELWLSKMAGIWRSEENYTDSDIRTIDAIRSRIYICKIVNGELVCTSKQTRGSQRDRLEHDQMFLEFKQNFDRILAGYMPADSSNEICDSEIEDAGSKAKAIQAIKMLSNYREKRGQSRVDNLENGFILHVKKDSTVEVDVSLNPFSKIYTENERGLYYDFGRKLWTYGTYDFDLTFEFIKLHLKEIGFSLSPRYYYADLNCLTDEIVKAMAKKEFMLKSKFA